MKKEEDYNIFDWWKKVVFQNYANFTGRARRQEYWSFRLVNFIMMIALMIPLLFSTVLNNGEPGVLFFLIASLIFIFVFGTIVPNLAVICRRLHDTNRSGTTFLFAFIPLVGGILLLVYFFSEGTNGKNIYGKDPKLINDELQEIGEF